LAVPSNYHDGAKDYWNIGPCGVRSPCEFGGLFGLRAGKRHERLLGRTRCHCGGVPVYVVSVPAIATGVTLLVTIMLLFVAIERSRTREALQEYHFKHTPPQGGIRLFSFNPVISLISRGVCIRAYTTSKIILTGFAFGAARFFVRI